ncbi:MAG: 3-methyl-2-oxobutanoate hydroxymethyltransferase [Leptospirales bacterium]|jgi:3-methyl-2-oxobutanoate hydroxymethyltransferase
MSTSLSSDDATPARRPLRFPADWIKRKAAGERISVLTAYDATMARLLASSSVDALLIGDSLGMVVQGQSSTLPVTLDEMIYHSRMVRRGAPKLFLIGDLPFGSYQTSVESGIAAGIRLMKESGVDAVKVEGAEEDTLNIIRKLSAAGVPVMGHIGLTPQSYLTIGGFRAQGRDDARAALLRTEARSLQSAGCFAMVLELVTADLTREITAGLEVPTISIGSGPGASGQVLVTNDLLGLDERFQARHVKRYANLGEQIKTAAQNYDREVHAGSFPGEEHSFR